MHYVDLTLEIRDGLQTYKSHPPIKIEDSATFENTKHLYVPPCCGFGSKKMELSDHAGTHIDAPNHFIKNGQSVDEIPIENILGSAIMLDCSHMKKHHETVTADMLERAEREQGLYVEKGDIVFVRTYTGTWGDEEFWNARSFAACAGEWFARKEVSVIGLDLANADEQENMGRPVHMALLSRNIYIIENLIHLDKLPRHDRFTFMTAPLKLKGATASPIRALAFIDKQFI